MFWMIFNKRDPAFVWNNDDGWIEATTGLADWFTDEEHDSLSLPIDGVWQSFTDARKRKA